MGRKRCALSLVVLGMALGIWAAQTYAQKGKGPGKEGKSAAVEPSEKTFPFDDGPDTIAVSTYPVEQQGNYKIFARKCSKCHTLARAINSPYALPEEWDAYVKKMQKKKRSGLDAKSAKKIIAFLEFDSAVRKKDLIEKKKDLIEKKLKEKEAK